MGSKAQVGMTLEDVKVSLGVVLQRACSANSQLYANTLNELRSLY